MEFSYRLSGQDFREAQRVFSSYTLRRDRNKIVLWTCILLGLLALRGFLLDGRWFSLGHGPFVPMLAVAIIVGLVSLIVAGQRKARKNLKNFLESPTSKREFAINLTPEGLTIADNAGTSLMDPWSSYEFWIEGSNVIVLVLRSGLQSYISVSTASKEQRSELRAILAQALPKR